MLFLITTLLSQSLNLQNAAKIIFFFASDTFSKLAKILIWWLVQSPSYLDVDGFSWKNLQLVFVPDVSNVNS